MGGPRTESMEIRSGSKHVVAALHGRAGFTIKSFCKIPDFTHKMCMRLRCARWHSLNLRLDAAALGVSMDIRCILSRMRFLRESGFFPGLSFPFFFIF